MKKLTLIFIQLIICYVGISQCDFRRDDISDSTMFSEQDQIDLRNAIMDYLTQGIDINDININSPDDYPIVDIHNANYENLHGTGTEIFLTWHRAYVQGLEQYLLSRGLTQFVPLPYWNPYDNVPDAFFNDEGTDSLNSVLPVLDGFPPLMNQMPGIPGGYFNQFIPPAACSYTNLTAFSAEFELYHGLPHNNIGGTMSMHISPGAAIFWLYHAWVDEIYYCYQKECLGQSADIYIRDGENDNGTEPSVSDNLWTSPDIWVRNFNDGFENTGSEGLCFKVNDNDEIRPVYVYVRVWNAGDMPNEPDVGDIKVYWAQGSTALSWPNPWETGDPSLCGQPSGGFIGSEPLRTINNTYIDELDADGDGNTTETEEDFTIYEFEWLPPNPEDYNDCLSEDWMHRHFCIHARINEPNDPTVPSGDYYFDLRNDNNLAMNNIHIFGEEDAEDSPWIAEKCDPIEWFIDPDDPTDALIVGPDYPTECLLFGNYTQSPVSNVELGIKFNSTRDWSLMRGVNIQMFFSGLEKQRGEITTRAGNWNAEESSVSWNLRRRSVFIQYPYISGFYFNEMELAEYCLHFSGTIPIPAPNPSTGNIDPIEFDIIQKNNGKVIGGERYVLHIPTKSTGIQSVEQRSFNVDNLNIDKQALIYPNPAKESFTLQTPESNKYYDVIITNSLGQRMSQISNIKGEYTVSTAEFSSGVYLVTLIDKQSSLHSTQSLIIE